MRENKHRPAMQPKVEIGDGYEEGKDAKLTVDLEVLPEIEAPSLEGLKLERLTVPVSDAEVDEAVSNIAGQQTSWKDAPKSKKAADGDQLIIDFTGSIDGVEFEGGAAKDTPLLLGAGRFIPGFEEQLVGAKAGDDKTITVTFPKDYPAKELAGKDAQFAIHVQKVQVEDETKVDEDFAKSLGLESLEQLRGLLKGQLEQELNGLTRTAMKRQLLDTLASGHDFPVPQGMVDAEFEQIWQQLQQEAAQDEDPAAAQLRAPLYEDKVVDFLFDKAEVTDREVTREELQAAIEAEETPAPAPANKKAPAKKKAEKAEDAPAPKKAAKSDDKAADKKAAKGDDKSAPKKAPAKKPAAKPEAKKADDKPAAKKAPAKKAAAKK
jgi:trigger factor